ncbi:flagellar biosynthetic protein FliR [Maricaulis sp. W15]|uniref:Flagellar biosynthetic protein FliR n=1 Tax=Maricaulis maris TaxID=74318 RepID=A0A495DF29_9PROT|nr:MULTISPECIES: flagellar biosynthetic protein FliR [Maricaulis]OLF74064.1 flagellar biosynthetic protein FliR [Maricaulis sp. W15]RKR00136.1 flagellar biosynthetic protein FliR [Maricaulis maris]
MIPELPALVYAAGLVFARLGAILMLLPGFGEPSIPVRIRLAFALLLCLIMGPIIAPSLPAMPAQPLAMAGIVMSEVITGLMIGAVARIFVSTAAVAGQVIGMQSGLAMAQSFDPSQGSQGALIATFLNLTFLLVLLATNTHHMLLQMAVNSYSLFEPGVMPSMADAAEWALSAFSDAFRIGVQLASPLILYGLLFYLALGVLSRLMPQAQIFFIAMPSNIMVGLFILTISLGAMSAVWLERMQRFATDMN